MTEIIAYQELPYWTLQRANNAVPGQLPTPALTRPPLIFL